MTSLQTSSAYEATIPASEPAIDPAFVGGNLEVERVMTQKGKPVGIIRVEMEETLGHYAEWLEIPTKIIRRLNRFPYSKTLKLHMKVKIPLNKISKEQFEETRFEFHKKIQEDFFSFYEIEAIQVYQLKKGDNIWTLCNDTFEMPVWLFKKYNSKIDLDDLRYTQKLMIPVIKEVAADAGDRVLPSPTVATKPLKDRTATGYLWADFNQLWLFMVQIFVCILLMAYLPELRWKTKRVFVLFKRVFEYVNPNAG
jgi:membrane-bound lytic murein transglycosylase D